MPKRTVRKGLKKKSRTSKRRFKKTLVRRKKIVRRKGKSKRKIFKKWKGHKSVYKFASSQGLKYSTYMSLAQFLTFQYSDFVHYFLAAIASTHGIGSNYSPTSTMSSQAKIWLSKVYRVFPTSIMQNHTRANSSVSFWSQFLWKAFNPIISTDTVGPYLFNMLTLYDRFKFVGVQVKWRPNVKFVTANTPGYSFKDTQFGMTGTVGNATNATIGAVPNKGTVKPVSDMGPWEFGFFDASIQDMHFPDNDQLCFSATTPVTFRLWVNFQKNGYESDNVFVEKNINEDTQSGALESKFVNGGRALMRRIFDDYGRFIPSNSKIKCYNLNKPFKFYVTPMVQQRVYEPITNETTAANYEVANTTFQRQIENALPNNDVIPSKMIRAGWMNVGAMQPWTAKPEAFFPLDTFAENQAWLVAKIKEKGYYDPVLFSTFLTCDNLLNNQYLMPFGIASTDLAFYTQRDYAKNFKVEGNDFITGMGKFKVTFYVKFKHRRRNPMFDTQAFDQIVANAMFEKDVPGIMETEPSDFNS